MATKLPNGEAPVLKYLFEAYYKNGEIIAQNPEDTSALNSEKSAFFDVLEKEKTTPLSHFALVNQETDDIVAMVNLNNGVFTVNGVEFNVIDKELKDFKLIFFRVRDTHFNIGAEVLGHDISYRIGWEAFDVATKKKIQRYIELK